MITLWGRTNSSNVMKVMWLLDELALPHRRIDAGGSFGGTDTPEFRAMSPMGLVPALRDGDLALFESHAILRYLCRAHAPASSLYPPDPGAAAVADAWLDFLQTTLVRPQSALFVAVVRTPPERHDSRVIATAAREAGEVWAVLEARLASHPFVAGEAFGIADIAFGPQAHRWFAMPIERPDLPRLRAWYDRLAARPAYARTCMAAPS